MGTEIRDDARKRTVDFPEKRNLSCKLDPVPEFTRKALVPDGSIVVIHREI